MFVKVTHSSLKGADGKPASSEVPIEALAIYEDLGWKVDKADLKAQTAELEAESKP